MSARTQGADAPRYRNSLKPLALRDDGPKAGWSWGETQMSLAPRQPKGQDGQNYSFGATQTGAF